MQNKLLTSVFSEPFLSLYQNFYILISPYFTMFSGALPITSPTPAGPQHQMLECCPPHPKPSDLLPFLLFQLQAWTQPMPILSRATAHTCSDLVPSSSRPRHRAHPCSTHLFTMVLTCPSLSWASKHPWRKTWKDAVQHELASASLHHVSHTLEAGCS